MTASSMSVSVTLVLGIALMSRSAEAQVCTGSSPFSNGNVRLGLGGRRIDAGLGSADGGSSTGFQIAAGASRGAFGSVGVSAGFDAKRFINEGFAASGADDALSGTVSASGGYGISVSTSRHVELCPITGFALQSGPQMWKTCTPLDTGGTHCSGAVAGSARAVWFGGSIGILQGAGDGLAWAPFTGAAYVTSRIDADDGSHTDGYVEISVGAGLLVSRATIRPSLSFPIGLEEGTIRWGLQFAMNVGPKRQP